MQRKEESKEESKKVARVKVSNIVKATPRNLKIVASFLKGMPCKTASGHMMTSKKRIGPCVSKVIQNGVHLLKKHHGTNPLNTKIEEAYIGKFKAFRKLKRYAKGRGAVGKSHLTRLTLILVDASI